MPRFETPPTTDPLPFDRLGHYEIRARLGRGGMGDVYKAYEPVLDRMVAIKVLPEELARQDEFVARFRAEASAIARIVHPNIVGIHYVGEDSGRLFFAMRYVDGESLAAALARGRTFDLRDSLEIIEQVLAGLREAHRMGFVHRDIKPANILLDAVERRALLTDFGLVRSTIEGLRSRTVTGVVLGTADYLSPEQGMGRRVTPAADLYSIGMVLYRLLAGRLPWEAATPAEMIYLHVLEPPPPIRDFAPDVPEELAAIIARLLSKRPEDRHRSAEELSNELRTFRAGVRSVSADGSTEFPSIESTAVIRALRDEALPRFDDLAAGKPGFRDLDTAIAEFERRRAELRKLAASAAAALADCRAQAIEMRAEAGAESSSSIPTGERSVWDKAAREADRRAETQERELATIRAQLAHFERLIGSCRLRVEARRRPPPATPPPADDRGPRTLIKRMTRPVPARWLALSVAGVAACFVAVIWVSWNLPSQPAAFGTRAETDSTRSDRRGGTSIVERLDANQPMPKFWPPERRLRRVAEQGARPGPVDRVAAELERNGGNLVSAFRTVGAHTVPVTAADPGEVRGLFIGAVRGSNGARILMNDAELAHLAGFDGLRSLELYDVLIDVRFLETLERLPNLATLELRGSTVLPEAFERLSGLPRLAELELAEVPVNEQAAAALSRLSGLRRLRLIGTGVGDEAMTHLGRLSGLESLHVRDCEVTDAGLSRLDGLSRLIELDLSRTRVSAVSLPPLATLEQLVLASCPVSDEGLQSIGRLTNLESLDLMKTKITAAGLPHLLALRKLETLSLLGTPIAADEAAVLRGLPKLREVTVSRNFSR